MTQSAIQTNRKYDEEQMNRQNSNLTNDQNALSARSQNFNQNLTSDTEKDNFLREDIFLVKVVIKKYQIQNFNDSDRLKQLLQDPNVPSQLKQGINLQERQGQFGLTSMQTNSFQIPFLHYKKLFLKQLKPNFRNDSPEMKNQSKPTKKTQQQKKSFSSGKSQHQAPQASNAQSRRLKMMNKNKPANFTQKDQNFHISLVPQANGYIRVEQNYKFSYRRQIYDLSKSFHVLKSIADKSHPQTQKVQKKQFLKQHFQNNSYMFTMTKDATFKICLNEMNYAQNLLRSINLRQTETCKFHSFVAKFPLKPFLDVPFTQHQIDLKLFHMIAKEEKFQEKQQNQTIKRNAFLQLSIFCVPGDRFRWGKLIVTNIFTKFLNRKFQGESHERIYVCLKFQFPDAIKNNRISALYQETELVLKVLSLQHDENPLWDDYVEIFVNPRRNKIVLTLIQLENDQRTLRKNIASTSIDLFQSGFLFDGVKSKKHIILDSADPKDKQNDTKQKKVADLSIQFAFQMTKSRFQGQESQIAKDYNSFVDANLVSF